MKTLRPAALVVADEVERLVEDDRLDHVHQGRADDGADLGLVPPRVSRSTESRSLSSLAGEAPNWA